MESGGGFWESWRWLWVELEVVFVSWRWLWVELEVVFRRVGGGFGWRWRFLDELEVVLGGVGGGFWWSWRWFLGELEVVLSGK